MIDRVYFENAAGEKFMPWERFGMFLKSHSVSPAKPKLHTFSLDGMDGELDLTEWAGEVRYEPREVKLSFRDVNESAYRELVQFALGRRVKVMLSDDPDYYYEGRCGAIETDTERRVTDVDMTVTCGPYRLARAATVKQIAANGQAYVRARRMTATPTVTATAACTIGYGGETFAVQSGTHTVAGLRITDELKQMTVTGNATVTLTWTDGVL